MSYKFVTKLNLPEYKLKYKETEKGLSVFDIVRKKYILLTPEEYVRQQFINYLIQEKQYPRGLLAVERQLKIYKLTKRTDIVLHDKIGNISVIIECKAPKVKISQDVFDQIARYNLSLKAKYLMLTNGLQHYYCEMNFEKETYVFLEELPNV